MVVIPLLSESDELPDVLSRQWVLYNDSVAAEQSCSTCALHVETVHLWIPHHRDFRGSLIWIRDWIGLSNPFTLRNSPGVYARRQKSLLGLPGLDVVVRK